MTAKNKPVNSITLARWMKKGVKCPGVIESNDHLLETRVFADALGLALIGKYGSPEAAIQACSEWEEQHRPADDRQGYAGGKTYKDMIAELLDIPLEIVEQIDRLITHSGDTSTELRKKLRNGEILFKAEK